MDRAGFGLASMARALVMRRQAKHRAASASFRCTNRQSLTLHRALDNQSLNNHPD